MKRTIGYLDILRVDISNIEQRVIETENIIAQLWFSALTNNSNNNNNTTSSSQQQQVLSASPSVLASLQQLANLQQQQMPQQPQQGLPNVQDQAGIVHILSAAAQIQQQTRSNTNANNNNALQQQLAVAQMLSTAQQKKGTELQPVGTLLSQLRPVSIQNSPTISSVSAG